MAICPKCNKTVGIFVTVPIEIELSSSMHYKELNGKEKYTLFIHPSDTAECSRCGYKDFVERFYI